MNRKARHLLTLALLAALCAGGSAIAQTKPDSTPQKPGSAALPKTQYWFGVSVQNIPPVIAKHLKLQKDQGLIVMQVLPNSPAEKAGLKADDLLIKINDKKLTSQEELAHAANLVRSTSNGNEFEPGVSKITYMREGVEAETEITPAPRPTEMLVLGNRGGNFQLNASPDAAGNPQSQMKNYVLPSGVTAQVGPGYRIDLNSAEGTLTNKSIKQIVSDGKTVVLTRETDAHGKTKGTITVGTTTYQVDPDNLSKLPADLRPLAEQLLKQPARSTAQATGAQRGTPVANPSGTTLPQPGSTTPGLEERVKDLEQQNKQLQDQLRQLLKKPGAASGTQTEGGK